MKMHDKVWSCYKQKAHNIKAMFCLKTECVGMRDVELLDHHEFHRTVCLQSILRPRTV